MRLSVALCTYNGAAYLAEQLASLARQSRLPDELVACDDGSTDGTGDLLKAFAKRAPFPVRLCWNERNLGSVQNFAQAIALCTEEIIFPADQDDIWLPAKIEKLAGLIEASPRAGLAFGDGEVVDAQLRPLGYTLWEATRFTWREQEKVVHGLAPRVLARHSVAHGAAMAFRADLRPVLLPIPRLRVIGHDTWTALIASGLSEVALLPEPVLRYRLHGGNVVGIRRRTFPEQIAHGRELLRAEAFRHEVEVLTEAVARLEWAAAQGREVRPGALASLRAKAAHLRARDAMPASLWRRAPAMAGEMWNGRYFTCALGWRSIAQDIFLR